MLSSTVVHIKPNTITSLGSVARQITKSILSNLKQRKVNHACMCSNVQTVVVITKQTLTNVHSGNIGLITNGTAENKPKFVKTGIS